MVDGVELAVSLYLPAESLGPQPCIVEALPYRKDDLTASYRPDYLRLRDDHGYAVCRVDVRGTGSSGGDATDEYPEAEQADLATLLGWLTAQPWCDGNIGIYGTSYSGFNALQMACEQPLQLKAIISIFASDDRYTDDVHYRGGALKFVDLVDYNHYVTAMNVLPPVPALWGDGWRDEWQRRIATNEPWLLTWMREQRDGAYWRHGSVRPGEDRIKVPTMLVCGWADGYRNIAYRLTERLKANATPHRLLAGPWAHAATDASLPGPRIDLLPEMAAWWDRWLRGARNGVDDGLDTPGMSAFVRSSTPPAPDLDASNGYWLRDEWPSPRIADQQHDLGGFAAYVVRPEVGTAAWIDCAGHLPWGQSDDQRFDDASSASRDVGLHEFDADLDGLTIMGHPRVRLQISADQPVASCSVKLCDVFADGTSALVSRGSLNLTHRSGHGSPQPMQPGQTYDVEVELDACAYRFEPGQSLRVSIAGADWPNTVAPPRPVTLTVHGAVLTLPVWRGASPYPPPTFAPGAKHAEEPGEGVTWRIERDVLARVTACVVDSGSTYPAPYSATVTEHYAGRVSVDERTFEQVTKAQTLFRIAWPDVTVATRATLEFVATATTFDVTIDVEACEGDRRVGQRHWHESFPRDLG